MTVAGVGSDGAFLRCSGFTLLELLVVMTLATLLVMLVPSCYSAMVPHVEERAEVRRFVLALRAARGAAIRDRTEVLLKLDRKIQRYYLPGSERIEPLPKSLTIHYKPPFAPEVKSPLIVIRFYADGSSNGGVIEMVSGEIAHRIAIDWLTGRVEYDEVS